MVLKTALSKVATATTISPFFPHTSGGPLSRKQDAVPSSYNGRRLCVVQQGTLQTTSRIRLLRSTRLPYAKGTITLRARPQYVLSTKKPKNLFPERLCFATGTTLCKGDIINDEFVHGLAARDGQPVLVCQVKDADEAQMYGNVR